ncbi:hypothetical protein HZA40_05235, partial [Candidatus Peregrinibacteria bacterium]|nr:hypothetical protein [Candidatus Peregrinibacteria bacterium]
HTFYWFPIGSVATVWKKFTPPNVCQSLTAKLYDNSIQVNGANAYPLSVSGITFAPQNMIPAETELKWTTDDPKGKFYEVIIGYSAAKDGPKHTIQNELTKNSDGTVNTDPDATIYYVGKPESKITVTLDKIPASQIGPQCNAQIVSPAAPECKEILVDHQEHIYEGTYSYFKAKSLDVDNKDLKAKIRYSVDPGYGEFYVIKPSDYDSKKNNSKIIFEATPSDQIVPFGSNTIPGFKIDPKILILGNLGDQIPISMIDIDTKIATGKFGIQDLSQNITDPGKLSDAVKKGNIILPDWMVSGLPPSTNPVDPFINPLSDQTYDSNPGKFGLNDVFNIDPNIAIGGQKIDVSKPNTEIINAKTYFINSLFETITVDPGTTVYFYAKKAGKGVIHVKTIGSAVGVCEKNYDIEAVCSKFSLTGDPAGLTVGQNATLKVTAKDNLGKNLPGSTNIKLSTDTQGTFNNTTLSDIIAKYSDPLTFKNSKKPGTITASIDPKDPLYNDVCKDSIPINPAPVAQCTAIHLTLNDASSGTPATQLEKNKKYIVSATIDTSAANGDKITYSIDPNYGYFIYVDISKPPSLTPISQITLDEVKAFPLILVTYDNVPSTPIGLIKDVLKVQGTGYGNECATSIPFNNPGVCKSITLTPNQNGFDPTNNNPQDSNPNDSGTTFLIGGDFSSHPGPIQVSINSSGGQGTKPTIKRANTPSQETGNGSISFTADEVKNSNNQLSFVYTRNN